MAFVILHLGSCFFQNNNNIYMYTFAVAPTHTHTHLIHMILCIVAVVLRDWSQKSKDVFSKYVQPLIIVFSFDFTSNSQTFLRIWTLYMYILFRIGSSYHMPSFAKIKFAQLLEYWTETWRELGETQNVLLLGTIPWKSKYLFIFAICLAP